MWQLLIPVALWLGMVGLGRAELTAAQQRGLQVALEEFHKHPPVQWAFKEIGVDSATDTVSGTAWGGEGWGQEAGAEALGLRAPSSPEAAGIPAAFSDALFHAGEEGQVTSSDCWAAQPAAGLCLSAALPCRDLCEAGI